MFYAGRFIVIFENLLVAPLAFALAFSDYNFPVAHPFFFQISVAPSQGSIGTD
jgi:hypothetical protein